MSDKNKKETEKTLPETTIVMSDKNKKETEKTLPETTNETKATENESKTETTNETAITETVSQNAKLNVVVIGIGVPGDAVPKMLEHLSQFVETIELSLDSDYKKANKMLSDAKKANKLVLYVSGEHYPTEEALKNAILALSGSLVACGFVGEGEGTGLKYVKDKKGDVEFEFATYPTIGSPFIMFDPKNTPFIFQPPSVYYRSYHATKIYESLVKSGKVGYVRGHLGANGEPIKPCCG